MPQKKHNDHIRILNQISICSIKKWRNYEKANILSFTSMIVKHLIVHFSNGFFCPANCSKYHISIYSPHRTTPTKMFTLRGWNQPKWDVCLKNYKNHLALRPKSSFCPANCSIRYISIYNPTHQKNILTLEEGGASKDLAYVLEKWLTSAGFKPKVLLLFS